MLGEIIPVIDAIRANKKLKEKNKAQNIEVPENIADIDIKYLEEDYKNTVGAKNRFEDKAKTNIAALTIAITLILNLSKMIETISDKFDIPAIHIFIFVLAVLAIIYMLMAGIMSIQVLIKENLVYAIPLPDKENKELIYTNTQLNTNQNLIRNNIIYSAYRSIRNSVFCLVIIFISAILPFHISGKESGSYMETEIHENISFGAGAVNWLINNEKDISFENYLNAYDNENEENVTRYIYDKENNIIVVIKKLNDMYVIDDIISDIEEIE